MQLSLQQLDATTVGPATRRIVTGRADFRGSCIVILAGALCLLAVHFTWSNSDETRERARGQQVAADVGLMIGARIGNVERSMSALASGVGALRAEPGASVDALTAVVFEQAPGWLSALAIVLDGDLPVHHVARATRAPSLEERLRRPDIDVLVQSALEAQLPRLQLLSDGRIGLARPAAGQLGANTAVLALIDRELLFPEPSGAAYVVRDHEGRVVIHRDGNRGALDPTAAAFERTIRPGSRPWMVEVFPDAQSDAALRWVLLLAAGLLILLLAAWVAQLSQRRHVDQAAARLYRTLFEVAAELVLVLDPALEIKRANSSAERIFGVDCVAADRPRFLDTVDESDRDTVQTALSEALHGTPTVFLVRLVGQPGLTYRFRAVPLTVEEQVLGLQVLGEDITEQHRLQQEVHQRRQELERLNRELYETSITDALTGVFNRRHLSMRAQQEVERATRHGHALACLFLDLDHFKRVNDTYGHAVGDQVLRGFAALLRDSFRGSDVIGRYGGEEFVVLLTETPATHLMAAADKILQLVRNSQFAGMPEDERITVSIGGAVLRSGGSASAESLFAAADAALYEAKNAGRDRLALKEALAA